MVIGIIYELLSDELLLCRNIWNNGRYFQGKMKLHLSYPNRIESFLSLIFLYNIIFPKDFSINQGLANQSSIRSLPLHENKIVSQLFIRVCQHLQWIRQIYEAAFYYDWTGSWEWLYCNIIKDWPMIIETLSRFLNSSSKDRLYTIANE